MKHTSLLINLLFVLISFPCLALGGMITVEPDDFDHGVDISSLNKGVNLQSISYNIGTDVFEYDSVYSITAESCIENPGEECASDFVAPTGSKVFGWKDSINRFRPGWGEVEEYYIYLEEFEPLSYLQGLMAVFSRNTNYVSIKGITTSGSSDPTLLLGLNSAGELVDYSLSDLVPENYVCCDSEYGNPYWSYETSISSSENDIAYIVVGGTDATTRLDHLTFNLSEPPIVPMFLLALGGLLLVRKRGRTEARI